MAASPELNKTSTVVKQFVVDFSSETYKPLMEHEVNGLDYRYVYSDKARLSVVVQGIETGSASLLDDAGELHAYYHCDYLGTTDYLTSAVNSKVISWTSYSEWGEITHNAVLKCGARELDLVKEYATHDFDAVLNMYYAKARFYDADNRRFTAVDPILDPSQYDLREYVTDPMQLVQYLYVKDNAINWIDPQGKFPWGTIGSFLHDAVSDARGRDILIHWLIGGGKELDYYNAQNWSTYMTESDSLTIQVKDIVRGYCEQVSCGETKDFNETIWPFAIDNGEQVVGYQYLHGVNGDVGGFRIRGSITKTQQGEATIKFTYQWNDIIDPNPQYTTDIEKSELANKFFNPDDYIIRIAWDDTSAMDKDGTFSSGWLGGEKWKQPKNISYYYIQELLYNPSQAIPAPSNYTPTLPNKERS